MPTPIIVPHDEPEIEAAGVNQQPLENIRVTAQMRAPHAARVIEVREGAFDPFAALAHQAASAGPADPSPIAIDRRLGLGRLRPIAATAVWFRDVRADADRVEIHHRLIAVVPLVGDDLFQRLWLRRPRPAPLRPAPPLPSGCSTIVVVSPWSAPCSVTATTAPVSRSTACSALWARCVRPSFIFVTFASGSCGFIQSSFDVFFFRFRSSRAKSSRVGVSMPEAFASPVRNS